MKLKNKSIAFWTDVYISFFDFVFLSLFSDLFCFLGCTGCNQGYEIYRLQQGSPTGRLRSESTQTDETFSEWKTMAFSKIRKVHRSFKSLKFRAIKSLKWYKKVLIMISGGLQFGDGKTRIAIWLYVTIKLQKAMISLNKYERCHLLHCFMHCGHIHYWGNCYISAVLKVPPSGRELICIFNQPVCCFCSDQCENQPMWMGGSTRR